MISALMQKKEGDIHGLYEHRSMGYLLGALLLNHSFKILKSLQNLK